MRTLSFLNYFLFCKISFLDFLSSFLLFLHVSVAAVLIRPARSCTFHTQMVGLKKLVRICLEIRYPTCPTSIIYKSTSSSAHPARPSLHRPRIRAFT